MITGIMPDLLGVEFARSLYLRVDQCGHLPCVSAKM